MFSRTLFSRLPRPLSCRIIAPLLTRHAEAGATLNADERTAVRAHLSACPSCQEEAVAVRAVGAFLRSLGPAAMPAYVPAPDLWERIEGRIITEQRESRRSFSLRPVLLFAPALAAIIVAVVLMQKPSPSPVAQTASAPAESYGVADTAKALTGLVAMDEARTTRPSLVAAPSATPAVTMAKSAGMKSVPRRIAMVESIRKRGRSPEIAPRTESAKFSLAMRVIPTPRNTRNADRVAQNVSRPKPTFGEITIVDVDATPAPVMVASARTGGTAPEPRVVTPSSSGEYFAYEGSSSKAITVVSSHPGSGVTGTAYAPPPVTDTMIRQRQRRGLFGGYSAGGAIIGALPATSGAGTGSETATPW
ncbi:MAG: zf-HC2 domain-containing protein [Fibrella sp.]|nr:zf-HC2 domain-containing protein [Armatimonadota bacterium]